MILINNSEIDSVFVELSLNKIRGRESRLEYLHRHRIEVIVLVSGKHYSEFSDFLHENLGHKSALYCNFFQACWPMPLHIE